MSADRVDPKGELLNKVINEVTGIRLVVPGVDFEGAYPSRIVDRGVLIPFCCLFVFIQKLQKLNINLYVMTRHLFLIPLGVNFTSAHIARKTVKAQSTQSSVDGGVTNPNIMITLQVPDDANRPQVILATQVNDLGNNLRGYFTGMVPGRR